jgi:hypothetical protein
LAVQGLSRSLNQLITKSLYTSAFDSDLLACERHPEEVACEAGLSIARTEFECFDIVEAAVSGIMLRRF